ncbi:hypothetical protein CAPTEDRAFT_191422 [Capitella teleta]|uniref:EGF-like domain-containing protein n=1 Tax=Capitella teleta TaxID=283909 RepID=R7U782_CAPTE|nr:hypothetical protein CAPTEDRAFT_191422 [Capitella teleta]|eukprot:ELU01976.1 hypothetical protein CAPTEDRAFT_191422 [Capitella teleta]
MGHVGAVPLCLLFLLKTIACDHCSDVTQGEPCGPDVCYHGTCHSSVGEFGPLSYHYCQCDDGWSGAQCEYCCDLICPEGYSCRIDGNTTAHDSQQYCDLTAELQVDEGLPQFPSDFIPFDDGCSSASSFTRPNICGEYLCFSGVCNTTSEECLCDKHWYGVNCDICCTLECTAPDQCHSTQQENGSFVYSCQPPGVISRARTPPETSPSEDNTTSCSAARRNTTTECLPSLCYNGECVEGNTTLRSIPGLTISTEVCLCDDGWFGKECNTCCDLPCVNGSCRVEPYDDKKACYCYHGYTGEFCEEEIPTPTTTTDCFVHQIRLLLPVSGTKKKIGDRAFGLFESKLWNSLQQQQQQQQQNT